MPYCRSCGLTMSDSATFCATCGALVNAPPPKTPAEPSAPAVVESSPQAQPQPVASTNSVRTPPTPSAPRRSLSRNAKVGIGVVVALIVGTLIISALGQSNSSSDSQSNSSSDKLSPEAKAYLDSAMPALAQVTSEYESGNVAQASADWQAIGDFPNNNSTDDYVSKDYLTYANNVRYFMVGDGSVNLKQLEDSRTKAEQTISAFQ